LYTSCGGGGGGRELIQKKSLSSASKPIFVTSAPLVSFCDVWSVMSEAHGSLAPPPLYSSYIFTAAQQRYTSRHRPGIGGLHKLQQFHLFFPFFKEIFILEPGGWQRLDDRSLKNIWGDILSAIREKHQYLIRRSFERNKPRLHACYWNNDVFRLILEGISWNFWGYRIFGDMNWYANYADLTQSIFFCIFFFSFLRIWKRSETVIRWRFIILRETRLQMVSLFVFSSVALSAYD